MAKNRWLANISGNPDDAKRALDIITAKLKLGKYIADNVNEDEDYDPDEDDVDEAINSLSQYIAESAPNIQMQQTLHAFEQYCDHENLNVIMDDLSSKITDYDSAMAAYQGFDTDWFRTIPLSNKAKQTLAANIIKLVQTYGHSRGPAFWSAILNGDAEIMSEINFRYNDQSASST